jgi:nitroreductase
MAGRVLLRRFSGVGVEFGRLGHRKEKGMDFWQVLEGRYSVRDFDTTVGVSESEVDRLLAAAIRAPSAGNRQPWHFYVVRDATVQQALVRAAYNQDFIGQAPVSIVICADAEQSAARYGGSCSHRSHWVWALAGSAPLTRKERLRL